MNDIWTWSAIALFLGPILAAMMIPVFKWLFEDWRRMMLLAIVLACGYGYYRHQQPAAPRPKPGHFRLEKERAQ